MFTYYKREGRIAAKNAADINRYLCITFTFNSIIVTCIRLYVKEINSFLVASTCVTNQIQASNADA